LEEHVMNIVARQRTPTRVRVHRQPPPWLRSARDLVVDKPCEAWRFSDLAAVVGVHPVTLSRAFAETYGRTLSSFVQQRRVAWARTELTNSDLPVGAVALAAGFSDHAHFSRTFRRLVGMTPTAYRDALRPDHGRPTHVGALRRERSGVRPARSLPASDSRIFAV
jgi:AraC-like DNA-binding protein